MPNIDFKWLLIGVALALAAQWFLSKRKVAG